MPETKPSAYEIGKSYFIQTATLYYTGRLVAIYDHELVIEDAAWIADTGRLSKALKTGEFHEIEPFEQPVIVPRGGIIGVTNWPHALPREPK